MKSPLAALLLTLAASVASAHGNISCPPVPKEEQQPQMALQRKLEGEGWKVRQVKNFKGCYEVYGFDSQGKKVEAFFHPKTLERVQPGADAGADKK